MIHFDLPKEKSSIIKVIGVGGGGSNAVSYMHKQDIEGVNFIVCNTDAQALAHSGITNRIQLGPHLTQGLGAGANPEIGRQATEESLEEIKRILEVNTKMAFITAGMGGGTGTGGAPILAKICQELGILTVGIVTTPFSYEGKKRTQQAEEGIRTLKQYVDTLLVISNDKLRHQFGNLKMREAFSKADNVLATAAKCITDVINSTGQINVDFADVCTVMRNGGVAILGNASAEGENRALRAIEEALNSPLLNDSDIQGAKWILININSASGEHEFTMDEVEVIQNYLLTRAGENTDVILGLGYDENLGRQIGITLIATGFEYKDPFTSPVNKKTDSKTEGKIIMVLGEPAEDLSSKKAMDEKQANSRMALEKEMDVMDKEMMTPATKKSVSKEEDKMSYLMPVMTEEPELMDIPVIDLTDVKEEIIRYTLNGETEKKTADGKGNLLSRITKETSVQEIMQDKKDDPVNETIHSMDQNPPVQVKAAGEKKISIPEDIARLINPVAAAAGGYLARPSNIYAESKAEETTSTSSVEEPLSSKIAASKEEEELLDLQMQLIEREDNPAVDMPLAHQAQAPLLTDVEDPALLDETEEQKRRAAERLQKLRNLSFNINAADPNNEFETVPAYIRRNMEMHLNQSHVEKFYSNYEVKTDEKNQGQISTINTFLDGNKPD
jgi:cell division protein FtsZ